MKEKIISLDEKAKEKLSDEEIKERFNGISNEAVKNIKEVGVFKMLKIRSLFKKILFREDFSNLPEMSKKEAMQYLKDLDLEDVNAREMNRIFAAVNRIIYKADNEQDKF